MKTPDEMNIFVAYNQFPRKLWNVKLVSRRPTSLVELPLDTSESAYVEEEWRETRATLKEKQIGMEQQVHHIWT